MTLGGDLGRGGGGETPDQGRERWRKATLKSNQKKRKGNKNELRGRGKIKKIK
jgi:hypothetical protein